MRNREDDRHRDRDSRDEKHDTGRKRSRSPEHAKEHTNGSKTDDDSRKKALGDALLSAPKSVEVRVVASL